MKKTGIFSRNRHSTPKFPGNIFPNNSIESFLFDSENESIIDSELLRLVLDSVHESIYAPEILEMSYLAAADRETFLKAPGEHYQLLSKLVRKLQIADALEIGTFRGIGSLAISQALPSNGVLYTNDIIPWDEFDSILTEEMFDRGLLSQFIGDYSDISNKSQFEEVCNKVDFIFLDGPKDGLFEYKFIEILSGLNLERAKYLFIDDIKFMNMIPLWRSIKSPKIDLTSLSHWSGSGFVDISGGLKIDTSYWP